MSLAEIVYLVEKKRISPSAYADLKAALEDVDHVFTEAPLTIDVVDAMRLVPRSEVPDMPDRIVAATATHLDVVVLSRDGRIRSSGTRTLW